jgi:xanthine/CO dehydrogenase XdhC/CoxF family maturation factor
MAMAAAAMAEGAAAAMAVVVMVEGATMRPGGSAYTVLRF